MLLRPILQKNPDRCSNGTTGKILFNKFHWNKCLRNDRRIQAGIANDHCILLITKPKWKQVPGEMSPWLTVQCNSDLPKNKKKCHMLPAKSLCSGVSTLQPRKESVKRIQGPAPLGKDGMRADPSSHHPDSRDLLHYSVRVLKAGIAPILFTNLSPRPK